MGKHQPHAVMVPLPTPGHINPMLKLAVLLHSRNFHITFVVTDHAHRCHLRSGATDPLLLHTLPSFRFAVVPDGLDSDGRDGIRQLEALGVSLRTKFPEYFRELLVGLNEKEPPVTCVVAGFMSSALRVAGELGILKVLFWTASACGLMGTLQIGELVERGYVPLKDESCLSNGYLDTELDWVAGMKGIRLRDLTRFVRTTSPDDLGLTFEKEEAEIGLTSWGVIINTFDELESDVLQHLHDKFPRLYTLGSMSALADQLSNSNPISLTLWKEDPGCLTWLDTQATSSVVYVNFGSIAVLTSDQLMEFAWGLARSSHPVLLIVRPDLVGTVPDGFVEATKERGFVASWCKQEEVLRHPAVGAFLMHAGWNSVLASVCCGVPMMCWPFFAEQPTNCRYLCGEWGVGMEIEGVVRREQVEEVVREVMDGEKGRDMRRRAAVWRRKAAEAVGEGGSSTVNLERLVKDLVTDGIRREC